MILAGDVGGTKTLLGLFERDGRRLAVARIVDLRQRRLADLRGDDRRLPRRGTPAAEPCRLRDRRADLPGEKPVVNLRWAIDARKLSRSLGNRPVALLNDLEASAHGLSELTPRQLVHLTPGLKPRDGNVALISPGTGLGMAILVRDGGRFIVSASEGGHVDFAPRDAEEAALSNTSSAATPA